MAMNTGLYYTENIIQLKNIYNGHGYLLTNNEFWTAEKREALKKWGREYNVVWSGPVMILPDDETFILFKLGWL